MLAPFSSRTVTVSVSPWRLAFLRAVTPHSEEMRACEVVHEEDNQEGDIEETEKEQRHSYLTLKFVENEKAALTLSTASTGTPFTSRRVTSTVSPFSAAAWNAS
jgi:hypothetical protein